MVRRFLTVPNEGYKCNRTEKRLIVSKSLMLKFGRGSGSVNADHVQVILVYSNKSAQDFIMILSWSEIFNN